MKPNKWAGFFGIAPLSAKCSGMRAPSRRGRLGSVAELAIERVANRDWAQEREHDADIEEDRRRAIGRDREPGGDDRDDCAEEAISEGIGPLVLWLVERLRGALENKPHVPEIENGDDHPNDEGCGCQRGNEEIVHGASLSYGLQS